MKRTLVLGGLAILICGVSSAMDLPTVISNLQQREKSIESIQFDFNQIVHFQQMDSTSDISGQALFAKSGKLKITKNKPTKQITISNGKKVWVYTPSYQQVWVGSAKSWTKNSAIPGGLVPLNNYIEELQTNFNLSLGAEEKKGDQTLVVLEAKPKNKDMGYALSLVISSESWLPTKTTYISDSAKIITTLSQLQVNPEINPNTFSFQPPPGTDIIPLK